ncbi:uncharacterized protein LOC126830701 [Patella vulgata]|uniref:uncharacterized protein LOC126830701 n=1 Tax=Patella vulgata TaxID=6465 RepID=UPI0024A82F98|nr:uncharacterized protein LOC126830701 [Patella vulgata]
MKDMFVVFVLFSIIGFYPNSVLCCNNTVLEVKVAGEVKITFDLDATDNLIQIKHGKSILVTGANGSFDKLNNTRFQIAENNNDRFSFTIRNVGTNDLGPYCLEQKSTVRCCTNLTIDNNTQTVTKSSEPSPTSKSPVKNKNDSKTTRPSDGNTGRNQTRSGDSKSGSMPVRPVGGSNGNKPIVPGDGNSGSKQTGSGDGKGGSMQTGSGDGKGGSKQTGSGDGKGGSMQTGSGDGKGGSMQTGSGDGKGGSKQTGSGDGNSGIIPGVVIMMLTVIIVIISIVFYKKYKCRGTDLLRFVIE